MRRLNLQSGKICISLRSLEIPGELRLQGNARVLDFKREIICRLIHWKKGMTPENGENKKE